MAWREAIKKPVAKPTGPKPKFDTKDDDWETDIHYQVESTEKSQRYGSTSVPGTGRVDHIDFKSIQDKVKTADHNVKEIYQGKNPNRGYGGKYGQDQVMDKSAADFSYQADVAKHSSQTDFKKGFGGTFGVDERAKDKSAVGFDYRASVEKHSSQTDSSKGFGGKFGKDENAQDKSAVGFSHHESLAQHSSQKDYSHGFGGKFGVQKEEKHRPASPPAEPKTFDKPLPPVGSSAGVGNIRARFENMKKEQEEETAKRVAEERQKRSIQSNSQRIESPPAAAPAATLISKQVESPPAAPIPSNIPVQQEPTRVVTTVDVSSLLRQRQPSSSSSKHEDDEDEWAVDHQSRQQINQQRSPSPIVPNSNNDRPDEGIRCIARYSYEKTENDELGFEENEIITNVEKEHDEWWFGRIGSRSGLFPANYVEEI